MFKLKKLLKITPVVTLGNLSFIGSCYAQGDMQGQMEERILSQTGADKMELTYVHLY
jgi:hypothetical protein